MPGSPIISRRRLLLLLYKVAIPQRGSCGRLLPYLATVMGGCSHLSHTFYGRLLPCLLISFMGGCSHVCSFLLWEAAPMFAHFFYGRLLPCLLISFMGGCSHVCSFLLWEAAPMFAHFFYGRLLPCLLISFMGGCSHIWSFLLWEAAPILSLFFYGRLLPCLAISSVGGCSHLRPFVLWEAAPTHLLDPTGIVSPGRLLPLIIPVPVSWELSAPNRFMILGSCDLLIASRGLSFPQGIVLVFLVSCPFLDL